MAESTTMTVRLPRDVKARLGRLAQSTKRTRSFLAGEAIASYVARELEIVEGIERAQAEVRAGQVEPHDAAMRRLRAKVGRLAKRRA